MGKKNHIKIYLTLIRLKIKELYQNSFHDEVIYIFKKNFKLIGFATTLFIFAYKNNITELVLDWIMFFK